MAKGTGLARGENVAILEKRVVGTCTWLNEANALPSETVVDVLTGLTRCSVPEFTKLFDYMLQQARAASLELDYVSDEDTLDQVKAIMSKAVDSYHALCTANKWHVTSRRTAAFSVICWNCGEEGHPCNKCPKPKNQAAIDANKKKWEASKNSGSNGGGRGGHRGASNGGDNKDDAQGSKGGGSQRQKWGDAGIRFIGGKPKASCKTCGAFVGDHSTKFHDACMSNPNFNLAEASPNHPLVLAWKECGIAQPGRSAPPAGGGASGDKVVIDKTRASAALAKLEREATSPDTPEIIAAFRNLLSLN